jgi:glutamate-1-semialdehyde aminotransferase
MPEMTNADKVLDLAGRHVTDFGRSRAYREAVHQFIPGGAHTYSKGDDQFPELAPAAIARGRGSHVFDIDGNEYVDCALGLGSVSLGHAYEPVLEAVRRQLELGVNFARPASIELEFAREFCAVVPGADRVKFAKNGSTLTSAAVKLARAYTGRDLVCFPGNHPFYSYDDWFIGTTACRNGIPQPYSDLSLTYDSTDPGTLRRLFEQYPGRIACVITEPTELTVTPRAELAEVQRLVRDYGALLIIDEMVTGYRAGFPGAFVDLGLDPDLVTWGKAMGNGFSFCAMTGRKAVMDLGGILQNSHPRVFLSSTTHGAEAHGIAAAQAVLREYQRHDVIAHHRRSVKLVEDGMRGAVERHRLQGFIEVYALPWRIATVCRDREGQISLSHRTLLLQEMIGRGVLFQGVFLPCFSHTDGDIAKIVRAFDESCGVYRQALDLNIDEFLVGQPTRPVFRKYNGCARSCPSTPCPHEAACSSSE